MPWKAISNTSLIYTYCLVACLNCSESPDRVHQQCTTIGCRSIINVAFNTARSSKYTIILERNAAQQISTCEYSPALGRWDSVSLPGNTPVIACNANEVVLEGDMFVSFSDLMMETKDSFDVTTEKRSYALDWTRLDSGNTKHCANTTPCSRADLNNTSP